VTVYRRETAEIIDRFLCHRLTFSDCIAALDAALTGLIPSLEPEHLPELRAVMLANNEIVREHMWKRERAGKTNAQARAATPKKKNVQRTDSAASSGRLDHPANSLRRA